MITSGQTKIQVAFLHVTVVDYSVMRINCPYILVWANIQETHYYGLREICFLLFCFFYQTIPKPSVFCFVFSPNSTVSHEWQLGRILWSWVTSGLKESKEVAHYGIFLGVPVCFYVACSRLDNPPWKFPSQLSNDLASAIFHPILELL